MSDTNGHVGTSLLWHWISKAPVPVVTTAFIIACLLFSTWVWNVEAEVGEARSAIAVNNERIVAIQDVARSADARLDRMEDKIDKLLNLVIEMKIDSQRTRYQSRYPNWDMQPQPKLSPSPSPLTNHREN